MAYKFDMHTSQRSSQWKKKDEPKSKTPRQSHLKILWFSARICSEGQLANKELYLDVLRRLCENIGRKRPKLMTNNFWIFHDVKTSSNRSTILTEFKAKNAMNTIDQLPYAPDLAQCDFFMFP
uniref:Mariner Mos1 transposase n=1 Tax=Bactrocera latifrons TaxID=174628 RepID=A0A0K8VBX8_BACLA